MKRNLLNFGLNIFIFVIFMGMTFTGGWLLRVPYMFDGTIVSLTRYDWGTLHWMLSLLFIILIIFHLILHWNWTKMCFRKFLNVGPKTLAIALKVMVLFFNIIAPIHLTKDFPSRKEFKNASQSAFSFEEDDSGLMDNICINFINLDDAGQPYLLALNEAEDTDENEQEHIVESINFSEVANIHVAGKGSPI